MSDDWWATPDKVQSVLREEIKIRDDLIATLNEQLEAARHDAKEAEAYAEGLERDLKTCCMAQVVMDNTVVELEAKLSTCEEIGRAFEADAGQLRDKLAKVVNCLWMAKEYIRDLESHEGAEGFSASTDILGKAYYATVAEIEGEKG